MKKLYGHAIYVQSAGVENCLEIDGFAITVCKEIGVELDRHRARSFEEIQELGDDLSGFDLIVALSPASRQQAMEFTRYYALDVEYWPILDPTGHGKSRDIKLDRYRQARSQIFERICNRFGEPERRNGGNENEP